MKPTVTECVSVEGVMQGLGGPDEDRRGGFERGGWALPLVDEEVGAFLDDVYARADAFLFGPGGKLQVHGSGALVRWLLENELVDELNLLTFLVVIGQGTRLFPETGPDRALDLVDARITANGVTLQVFRPSGRPEFATSTAGKLATELATGHEEAR